MSATDGKAMPGEGDPGPHSDPWHENDAFWEEAAAFMFHAQRLAATAEEIDRILAHLKIDPPAPVLDLCCGPGRHSLELARRGYAVTGVDRTPTYLARARDGAAAEGLAIEFVRDDMRAFRRPEAFAAALNLYTSFGFFEDPAEDRRVAVNLFASLRPGGRLVMEMMGKEILARRFRERDWWQEESGAIMLEERRLDADWSHVNCRWILLHGNQRREFPLRLRLYSAVELTALLREVGFEEVAVYGSLAEDPYDHTAKRLVAVARKGGA